MSSNFSAKEEKELPKKEKELQRLEGYKFYSGNTRRRLEYERALKNRTLDKLEKEIDTLEYKKYSVPSLELGTTRHDLKELEYYDKRKIQENIKEAQSHIRYLKKIQHIDKSAEQDRSNYFLEQREHIQKLLDIKPIPEFGTNYAEFYRDGQGAIGKLLSEKQGQVAGAFYKEGLGDIDLVWGDSKKGLQHILERRTQDFINSGMNKQEAEAKTLELIESLPQIIDASTFEKGNTRAFLETQDKKAVVALDYSGQNNKWILTAYIKEDKAPISAYPHQNKLTDSSFSPIDESALNSTSNSNPTTKPLTSQDNVVMLSESKHPGYLDSSHATHVQNDNTPSVMLSTAKHLGQKEYYEIANDIYNLSLNNALDHTLPDSYTLDYKPIDRLQLFHKYYSQKGYPEPKERSLKDLESLINTKKTLNKQDLSDLAYYLYNNAKAFKDNKPIKMDRRKIKPSHMVYELAKQSQKEIENEADTLINNMLKKYNIPYLHTKRDRTNKYEIPYLNTSLGYNLRELAYKEAGNDLSPTHKLDIAFLQNLKNKDFMNTDSDMKYFQNETGVFRTKYLANKLKEMLDNDVSDEAIKEYARKFPFESEDGYKEFLDSKNMSTKGLFDDDGIAVMLSREAKHLIDSSPALQAQNDNVVMLSGAKHHGAKHLATPETSHGILRSARHDKRGINTFEIFIDSQGRSHNIPKDIADKWKETFSLQSLEQRYKPQIPQEIRDAIGKDIYINTKDLIKMIENSREKYISVVKETFENPQVAFIDEVGDLMLARKIDDRLFFVNISRDYGDELLNVTLSPKGDNTLRHKLDKAQKIIIDKVSSELRDSSAHKASTGFLSSASKDTPNPTTKALTSQDNVVMLSRQAKHLNNNRFFANAQNDKNINNDIKTDNTIKNYFMNAKIADELAERSTKERLNDNLKALKELARSIKENDNPNVDIISRYSGFGGVDTPKDAMMEILEDIAQSPFIRDDILRAEHAAEKLFDDILRLSDTSYYTPHSVIHAIYQNLGFVEGRVLESSMGIGNFYASMPRDIFHRTQKVGIELDKVSALFAKNLHPDVVVHNMDFEIYEDRIGFDLVIGNPPYGNKKFKGHSLVAGFVKQSVELTKPNGLIVQVVSSNFLDSKANTQTRNEIARIAEFLGAIRLPSRTFSGTNIATDIVIFQKRNTENSTSWTRTSIYKDKSITLNDYFKENPEHILGELDISRGNFNENRFVVNGDLDIAELKEKLGEILSKRQSERDALFAKEQEVEFDKWDLFLIQDLKAGTLIEKEGQYFITTEIAGVGIFTKPIDWIKRLSSKPFEELSTQGKIRVQKMAKAAQDLAPHYMKLRDALGLLKEAELSGKGDIERLRRNLESRYEVFVSKYGKISENKILKKAYIDESSFYVLRDLDLRGRHKILDSRVFYPLEIPKKATDLQDAIKISKAYRGKIDSYFISELLGDKEAINKALHSGELFNDAGNIVSREEFLSGDLGAKIDFLENKGDLSAEEQNALRLLQSALPEPLGLDKIHYNLASHWVPRHVKEGFLNALGVVYHYVAGVWELEKHSGNMYFKNNYMAVSQNMEIQSIGVLESLLKNTQLPYTKTIQGKKRSYPEQFQANEMARHKLLQDFYEYVSSEHANEVASVFNRMFRRSVPKDLSDTELVLHGINPDITLYPHQKAAIAFGLAQKNMLLDHSVGAGKTFTMVALAMEYKRLGIAKRPLFVVPNHLVGQFLKDFAVLYPQSSVFSVPTDTVERKSTLGMLANSGHEFDALIMAHSTFDSISLSKKGTAKEVSKEIAELRKTEREVAQSKGIGTESKAFLRSLAAKINTLQRKLDDALSTEGAKEDSIDFEELGIDALFVDEAHLYKNLGFMTKNRYVRSIGNEKGSKKAQNMLHKVKHIQEKGGRVIFATGTPLVNSISEVYTWQRFLDPESLEKRNFGSYDAWLDCFGKIGTAIERTPVGTYRDITRLRGFCNIGELSSMYQQFTHFTDVRDTEVKRPNVEEIIIKAPASKQQKEHMQGLLKRYEALGKGEPLVEGDNFLNITNEGIKGALDFRIIDPNAEDFKRSKINLAINESLKLYKETAGVKGVQLIFLDRSTPKPKRGIKDEAKKLFEQYYNTDEEHFYAKLEEMAEKNGYKDIEELRQAAYSDFSLYEDIRDKLIKGGVPKEEIAFIHDYNSPAQKTELFSKVNSGEVRFLLGSTPKMGAGTNVQERVVGLVHIDAAWNPNDIEQRDGRVIRQGNKLIEDNPNFKVKIFRCVTEDSADAIYYAKLEQKAQSIRAFRAGKIDSRELEEGVHLTFEELKAIATGDKRELEIHNLKKELQMLEYKMKAIDSANIIAQQQKEYLSKKIATLPKEIQSLELDLKDAKNKKLELTEKEKKELSMLEVIADSTEPLFELKGYDVFLEKRLDRYMLSAISPNGSEIILHRGDIPKNMTYWAKQLLKRISPQSIEEKISAKNAELEKNKAELHALNINMPEELQSLETKREETKQRLDSLLKEIEEESRGEVEDESLNQNHVMQQNSKEAIKQKTIECIDNHAKTTAFKELSEDKQQAILRLKDIKPAPMPEGMPRMI